MVKKMNKTENKDKKTFYCVLLGAYITNEWCKTQCNETNCQN